VAAIERFVVAARHHQHFQEARHHLLRGDAAATLARLEGVRRPAYEAAAHATVDTDGLSVATVADAVLAAFAATEERVP